MKGAPPKKKGLARAHVVVMCIAVVLGLVLRSIAFPSIPPEVNRDEAALAYNAYSLLQTGKDEWGKPFPIVFQSFGDYKLAGYIYTLIPFVRVFGLSALAVRLPSLLAGLVLIPLMYLFAFEMSQKKTTALFAALCMAVAPWAVHYSRVGFEANFALMLFLAGLVLALRKKETWWSFCGSVALIFLSLLTYNAPLLLLPGIVGLGILFKRMTWKTAIALCAAGALAFLLVLPATRGKTGITIFTDTSLELQRRELRAGAQSIVQRVMTNPVIYYPSFVVQRFVGTFLPWFLVIRGGENPWHQAPDLSHLTWGLYFFVVVGFFRTFLKALKKDRTAWFVLGLLILSPLPAIITVDSPHATRSLFTLVLLLLLAAEGIALVWNTRKSIAIAVLVFLLVEAWMHASLARQRLVDRPQPEWNVGFRQAIERAEQLHQETGMPITMVGNMTFDYIYPLFYTTYPPQDFLHDGDVKQFGHYRFVPDQKEVGGSTIMVKRERMDGVEEYVVRSMQ